MKRNTFCRACIIAVTALIVNLFIFVPNMRAKSSRDVEAVDKQESIRPIGLRQLNATSVELLLSNSSIVTIDFYGENIFRLFRDDSGGIVRDPEAKPEAQILVPQARRELSKLSLQENDTYYSVSSKNICVQWNKSNYLMSIKDLRTGDMVVEEVAPILLDKERFSISLKAHSGEYFYGGGVQNGRFSHRGKKIYIENQNSWTDGGVASPSPFYWSTKGYAVMFYTFKKGMYDFDANNNNVVTLTHDSSYIDMFYMIDEGAVALLNDYYQLTGNPVLLPKFAFYEGHLNAYNRDYWKEDAKGILFEDGKRYRESQKDNGGVKESLNGEKNNYQFSARAVIDRYEANDMPLGWILPNDGYGAGYGQTETLDGNIANLKSFGDYARSKGVEIGLWTQSDLHPKEGISALLQRDIVKEVRDAGVRVLKTDVAWVGAGYSFGLNGVADVAHIMPYYGNEARPFIISLDGWAGTQRYASIWSGDQSGGDWEYIRFHIPTYIGSGLSGQPNITSDMDGIFGGRQPIINIRDFQWKTFTPMQLNMDGWGSNEKYPFALGEPAASINRMYLKLKSELLPYSYTYAKKAVDGKPLMRAMFLDYPNDYTYGIATRYQYMYGKDFLVAPIYQNTKSDKEGNDIRDGIYLPEGKWIDYFSGEMYEGNRVLNNIEMPIWKLPVFVRMGAIIPMNKANNNPSQIDKSLRIYELYPYGQSSFMEYDDDGISEAYRRGHYVTTLIESRLDDKSNLYVKISPTEGDFDSMIKEKQTELRINSSDVPKKVYAKVNGKSVKLSQVSSREALEKGENLYFYDKSPNLNQYASKDSKFANQVIVKNPQIIVRLAKKLDVSATTIELFVKGFHLDKQEANVHSKGGLVAPAARIYKDNVEAYSIKPSWDLQANADYYEVEFNAMLYSTIRDTALTFSDLQADKDYTFKVRAVNGDGFSAWTELSARTRPNPLELAIKGASVKTSVANQEGFGAHRFVDFAESGDIWHTKYGVRAVPFEIVVDLHTVNTLDKFWYLPRLDAGNGTLLRGSVSYSMDNENWIDAGSFDWKRNSDTKEFIFKEKVTARFVKLYVKEAVGYYGSGRELYIFKVAGTESYLQGDINNDSKIDENDLTSYINYTGLRRGDSDFEGYISKGDINNNGLIDAYDISVVATQLGQAVSGSGSAKLSGELKLKYNKKHYKAGETVELLVEGVSLNAVNALSFALEYSDDEYQFLSVQPLNMKDMENLTYDRLHKNGKKSLYPTFVNIGEQSKLSGDLPLFIIKFKAKKALSPKMKISDIILVDDLLHSIHF